MLIKSILMLSSNPFLNYGTVSFFHLAELCSSSCCAVSRVIKWHVALLYDTSTGVTLMSRGNSASKKLQGLVVLYLQDSPRCSILRVLGDVIAKILP
jgi:hypothetical protein